MVIRQFKSLHHRVYSYGTDAMIASTLNVNTKHINNLILAIF